MNSHWLEEEADVDNYALEDDDNGLKMIETERSGDVGGSSSSRGGLNRSHRRRRGMQNQPFHQVLKN